MAVPHVTFRARHHVGHMTIELSTVSYIELVLKLEKNTTILSQLC